MALWALLAAQIRRLPVAPTTRMALGILALLRQQGVIDVPWPEARWVCQPDAQVTPIEGLQWRLAWTVYETPLLCDALEDYFESIDADDTVEVVHLHLWVELGAAESERFFEQQLNKHHFPSGWAQDMTFVYGETAPGMTLAQWRYCAWAAVRHGASVAMQRGPNANGIRDAIYSELRRRSASVRRGAWPGCALVPFDPSPESALARCFVRHVTRLGALYWTERPSVQALHACTFRSAK